MANAYDALPPAEVGEQTPEDIFVEVGRSLSTWEAVEDVVADIFAVLTGAKGATGQTAAKRAYGTILTSRGRTEMVNAAAMAALASNPPILREVKALMVEIGRFSARRNEIAHGKVIKYEVLSVVSDPTWYLAPPQYNTNKSLDLSLTTQKIYVQKGESREEAIKRHMSQLIKTGLGKYKYNASQIKFYNDQFNNLTKKAQNLLLKLKSL